MNLATLLVVLGVLLVAAGAAWALGPIALCVAGVVLVAVGLFAVRVDRR